MHITFMGKRSSKQHPQDLASAEVKWTRGTRVLAHMVTTFKSAAPVPERQTELDFFLETPRPIGFNNPVFTAELLLGLMGTTVQLNL